MAGMTLDCAAWLAKYLICLFNFIFFLAGSAVLGIGIWLHVDKESVIAFSQRTQNPTQQEDRHSAESEFPGVGQSCPGCGRRFERGAALASHVHSCYKQVLLAAQKAKRAIKKQPKPKTPCGTSGEYGTGSVDADKGYQESREDVAQDSIPGNGEKCENVKEEGKYIWSIRR